jgi:formate hydrogenlyase subunit 3/multisubunit Na+/H+ antiporter MnhD subunit
VDTLLAAGALLAIGLPLLAAAALAAPALRSPVWAMSPWIPVPALTLALWAEPGSFVDFRWLLLGTRLGVDDTSRVFLFFTGALWIACAWYARHHLAHDPRRHHFLAFFLTSMAGNIGAALAADMVAFYLFFALMSFAPYGLVAHGRDPGALRAGRVYIALVVAGEVLLFAGIVGSAGLAGHAGFSAAGEAVSRSPSGYLMLACIAAGFAIKAGAVPLHLWMPLAYQAAPIPGSAALSGPMIKAGLLGWLRFLPLGVMPLPALGTACMIAGFTSAFWGVAVGLAQKEPKAALAYSSISQMGLITTGIGVGLLAPESWPLILPAIWLYALHHACAKTALFLGTGLVPRVAAQGWRRRAILAGLALPAVALAGAPLSSGGIAKIAMKKGIESATSGTVELLLSIAAIGTTLLMARFLVLVRSPGSSNGEGARAGLWLPWAASLAAVALLPWVLPWRGFRNAAFESLAPEYLWAAFWPLAIGLAIAAAVWRWPRMRRSLSRVEVPPGDLLVPLQEALDGARRTPLIRGWRFAFRLPSARWRELASLTLAGSSARVETGLGQWGVVGLLVLALLLALFALLTV